MARFGMVIDLRRCVGCGTCALACKAEHNTRTRAGGQSFNWADFVMKTEGKFPNVTQTVMPVLCNHCTDAACVKACPVTPKAMYKTPEGITLHDNALCIGCRSCQMACPYSHVELTDASLSGETYSVISFNAREGDPQPQWTDASVMIAGVTASGLETARAAGAATPAMNQFEAGDVQPSRKACSGEKPTRRDHRTTNGQQPAGLDPGFEGLFFVIGEPERACACHEGQLVLRREALYGQTGRHD